MNEQASGAVGIRGRNIGISAALVLFGGILARMPDRKVPRGALGTAEATGTVQVCDRTPVYRQLCRILGMRMVRGEC